MHQSRRPFQKFTLTILIFAYIVTCCVSLVVCAHFHVPGSYFDPKAFHIFYDPARQSEAIAVVALFALVSALFLYANSCIGYLVGFYLYAMILGYLWLNCFSDFVYDHRLAAASAAVSAVGFLLPALFITSPLRRTYELSPWALDQVLRFILWLCAITIAVAASYNFRLVALEHIYDYRDKLEFPSVVNYLLGMLSSALLPFAFACFVMRKDYLRTGIALLLMLLFYPITLTKLAFFTPLWLIVMAVLSKLFGARIAVVLSLLGPTLTGVVAFTVLGNQAADYFGVVNFRMSAIPSNAMDVYNDFFSRHDLTYFCQISILKPLINCPYREPLGLVMKKAYELGNFNASLFATEGIASVGLWFAPISAILCGLVIALGNRLSAGLPPRFILISGAVLPQVFLNVPLTTTLLTHGAAVLALLWYLTPQSIFEQKEPAAAAASY